MRREELHPDHHEVILDSINEGVFTVDLDGRVTSFNRAAERITGISREDAIDRSCNEVFRASICENDCPLKNTLETSRPAVRPTVYIVNAAGEQIPIKVSAAVLRDVDGVAIGGVETFQDLRQVEALRRQLERRHTFEDIVGRSRAIADLFDLLPQVADSDSSVLIEGKSGTGKELFSRAIHNLSPRRRGPFVAINCGALPDSLLESELFGYVKGAFTDARRDKPGRFALAEGGTLLLDEIGDVTPAMQVRLLRVLQERTYEPLGAVVSKRADVRVIAASNQNLDRLVRRGTFREDLFYRLNVVRLVIPPLRDRREDIPLLINHFVARFNQTQGKEVTGASPEVLAVLIEHDYPGNVRELQNIIEHAFVLCRGGPIELAHLPPRLRQRAARSDLARESVADSGLDLRAMERALITEALDRFAGNRARAAEALGINPSTLYRKLKVLAIPLPASDGRRRSAGRTSSAD